MKKYSGSFLFWAMKYFWRADAAANAGYDVFLSFFLYQSNWSWRGEKNSPFVRGAGKVWGKDSKQVGLGPK